MSLRSYKFVSPQRTLAACRMALAALFVALLALCALLLSACKDTDVLYELIQDQDNGVLDQSYDPIFVEDPDAPEDPTKDSTYLSNSERIDEQEQTEAVYDEQTPSEEQTDQRESTPEGHDYAATQGNEEGSEGASQEIASNDDGGGIGGNDDSQSPAAGAAGSVEYWDEESATEPLPEAHNIAASGQYALIVQMLAGLGGLCAADQSFIDQVANTGAFPGEGVEYLVAAWDSEGNINLSALAASAPDVILVESGTRGLTEEEMTALAEEGLSARLVTVPRLSDPTTADETILSAVNTVGELLRSATSTQYNAQQSALQYQQLHDQTIENCLSSNGGYSHKMVNGADYDYIYQGPTSGTATTRLSAERYTTVFVDSIYYPGLSSVVSLRTYNNVSVGYNDAEEDSLDVTDGVGLSITSSVQGFLLMDYYLQCAGVTDNSFQEAYPVSAGTSTASTLPSVIAAGGDRDISVSTGKATRSVPSALWYSPTGAWESDTLLVGNTKFPGVFVRDESVASAITASASKENGFYNVGQQYFVYVMPSGLAGSWADGTVESFMLAPYAFCLVKGQDMTSATNSVNNFCTTFYRCGAAQVISGYGSYQVAGTATEVSGG